MFDDSYGRGSFGSFSVFPANPSTADSHTSREASTANQKTALGSRDRGLDRRKGRPKERMTAWHRQGRKHRVTRWNKRGPPVIKPPGKDGEDLVIGDRKAESLIKELEARLAEDTEKEAWLKQLSALLAIAEDGYGSAHKAADGTTKHRLRNSKAGLRKSLGEILGGFVKDADCALGVVAREVTSLTNVVLSRMEYDNPGPIYDDHCDALSSFVSLEDATSALSDSTEVQVGNVSIRTFVVRKEATASTSNTNTDANEE